MAKKVKGAQADLGAADRYELIVGGGITDITYDADNHRIVVNDQLSDGSYPVTLSAYRGEDKVSRRFHVQVVRCTGKPVVGYLTPDGEVLGLQPGAIGNNSLGPATTLGVPEDDEYCIKDCGLLQWVPGQELNIRVPFGPQQIVGVPLAVWVGGQHSCGVAYDVEGLPMDWVLNGSLIQVPPNTPLGSYKMTATAKAQITDEFDDSDQNIETDFTVIVENAHPIRLPCPDQLYSFTGAGGFESYTLPRATGGNPPLTYELETAPNTQLVFNPQTLQITTKDTLFNLLNAPTQEVDYFADYKVTDAAGVVATCRLYYRVGPDLRNCPNVTLGGPGAAGWNLSLKDQTLCNWDLDGKIKYISFEQILAFYLGVIASFMALIDLQKFNLRDMLAWQDQFPISDPYPLEVAQFAMTGLQASVIGINL